MNPYHYIKIREPVILLKIESGLILYIEKIKAQTDYIVISSEIQ